MDMTLGDLLKQHRAQQQLSQADLAEKMGIEQSYLSKLEGDRSLPSDAIFAAWLSALELSVDDVLTQLDKSYLHAKLSQLPDVHQWLREHSVQRQVHARLRTYIAVFFIAIAVPLFYLGQQALVFDDSVYEYNSPGLVMPGERPDIFYAWHRLSFPTQDEKNAFANEMIKREDRKIQLLRHYRGEQFNEPIENAPNDGFTRTYYLKKTFAEPRWQNTLMQALGLFFGVFGLVALLLELKRNKN